MFEIQRFFLEYIKLSSLVNIIRSKMNIKKFLMNATLEVFLMMTVPDVGKYCGR